MRRADGSEIGTVAQENDVPAGLLDGPWGDVAYTVALAAQDGIMQLIARGALASGWQFLNRRVRNRRRGYVARLSDGSANCYITRCNEAAGLGPVGARWLAPL